ncbi:MAG: HypC/HybG/HupF family hydrogenase formation chaperone [Candidatus Omnitrophica bacterium]|nr:HypC/HybG/HupF family hydrogenase formation chaperone [Candidatus Omnitrophota bacterium]
MCLGIPVKIKSIKGNTAVISAGGAQRTIGIELTPDVKVGNYVLLHAGFAIEVISESNAKETLKLLNEMFEKG